MDEQSQIQALDRSAPTLPILPATPARRAHDDVRHGTASLFAALDVASGQVISQVHRRHRHQEFLRFLKQIDANVPAGLELHLVCGNDATHKTPAIKTWLLRHPPVPSASHPDLGELAESGRALVRRADRPQAAPRDPPQRGRAQADLNAWIADWNDNPKPFVWTKTADQILDSLTSHLQRANDSGH